MTTNKNNITISETNKENESEMDSELENEFVDEPGGRRKSSLVIN
jgi:hypothetical protein